MTAWIVVSCLTRRGIVQVEGEDAGRGWLRVGRKLYSPPEWRKSEIEARYVAKQRIGRRIQILERERERLKKTLEALQKLR